MQKNIIKKLSSHRLFQINLFCTVKKSEKKIIGPQAAKMEKSKTSYIKYIYLYSARVSMNHTCVKANKWAPPLCAPFMHLNKVQFMTMPFAYELRT
jgi:hypothetical protein